MSKNDFYRLPPDGSGKRVLAEYTEELNYDGGVSLFKEGNIVTGSINGSTGKILRIAGTASFGTIWIKMLTEAASGPNFLDNETLQVSSVTYATCSGDSFSVYTQTIFVAGGNNPKNQQFVDNQGQAFTRFAEGVPLFGAYGHIKTSVATTLAEYTHDISLRAEDYSVVLANGGTVTYDTAASAGVLSTTSASGSSVTRTTNRYHRCFSNLGTIVEMTTVCGDAGKTNNNRSWGLFNDSNGLFFKLKGTTLQVVQRSSTSGSVVDTEIPQVNWNGDTADGLGLSGMLLDLTKVNIWWIDLQFIGRTRFGCFSPVGDRITLHSFYNANNTPVAYMQTASLPLQYENINTGTTGSTSELRMQWATVMAEGSIFPFFANQSGGVVESITLGATLSPVLAIRPKVTVNGRTNRALVQPQSFTVCVTGAGTVLLQVIENTILTGPTWAESISTVELDKAATSHSGGKIVYTRLVTAGSYTVDLSSVYDYTSDTLRLNADNTQTQNVVLVAKGIGGTPAISTAINWQELS